MEASPNGLPAGTQALLWKKPAGIVRPNRPAPGVTFPTSAG